MYLIDSVLRERILTIVVVVIMLTMYPPWLIYLFLKYREKVREKKEHSIIDQPSNNEKN
jgi:Ca2+/Na+ antiporter